MSFLFLLIKKHKIKLTKHTKVIKIYLRDFVS